MKIEILGIENDCIYIANERMVLRIHLRNLLVEDLNEETLYTKVIIFICIILFDFFILYRL